MKALRFNEDKKMDMLGKYNLDDVNNNVSMEGEDIRFTLYADIYKVIDGENKRIRVADVLLIDIDNCPLQKAKLFKLRLRKLLADVTYSLVFSGGGLHVYIPIAYGFQEKDKKNYKRSYDELCNHLATELNHDNVDSGVFGASKYGRVIGSTNTKYGTQVELLDVHKGGLIEKLSDLLDYEEVADIVYPEVITQAIDSVPFKDSPIYNYCNFIKYCDTEKERIGFDTWSDAINILNASGNRQHCHDVSKGHKGYDFDTTETKINSFTGYTGMSCGKVSQKNPTVCNGCKFLRVPQMSASTITGSRTTISLHRGHFQLAKNDEGYAIDYSKLDVDSLLNHFLNLHEGKLCVAQEWVYKLDENDVTWKPYFSSNLKSYGSLTKDLEALTQHEIKPTMLKRVLEYLKILIPDFLQLPETPSNLVIFKSNVFDTETKKFRVRLPEDYITGTSSTDVSNTKPIKWLNFLNESLSDARDIDIVQEFFGLALSRLKTYDYQYICWLHGLSGTGKSLMQTILGDIIGDECSVYFTKDELLSPTFNISNVTAKTFLAVSELSTGKSEKVANALEKRLNVLTDSHLVIKKLYFDKQTVTNRLTTIVTSNDAPPTRSMDQGGARRIRAIEFCKKPKEVNTHLRQELLEELPSIANWAIEGLFRVLDKGITEVSKDEMQALEDTVQENSSVMDFIGNSIEITEDRDDMIPTGIIFVKYDAFCDAHKIADRLDTRQLSVELVTCIQSKLGIKATAIRKRDSSKRYLRYIKWI